MPKLPSSRVQLQNRHKLLNQIKNEVKQYRLQSIHRAVLMNLAQETPPLRMRRSWTVDVKIGARPSVRVPVDTAIIQVFDRLDGKLLILGTPGAGKTTTLMGLAKVLVERALKDNNEPIPILLNLSSWHQDEQAIADWIIEQLHNCYGIHPSLGQYWMEQLQILPLLDGLDELGKNRQDRCIQKTNELLMGNVSPLHLVVCSSLATYQNCPTRLHLNGAILLRPLTTSQIKDYLMTARSRELWHNIEQESQLLQLAKIPLFLSMMTLAYEEILIMSWKHLKTLEEQRSYLFNAYIRHQITNKSYSLASRQGQELSSDKQRQCLQWLATRMQQDNLQEISMNQLPLTWLKTPEQKRDYQFGIRLSFGLFWGVVLIIIIAGAILGSVELILTGLILGLIYGLLTEYQPIKSAIEQFILRFVLWKSGCLPWNYRHFLNNATRRLLLQQRGDRYRFIHRLLQEHLAKI